MPDFGKYFTQTPSSPAAGAHVWKWVADIYDIPPALTFYATQVGSSYLVLSNDDKDLQKVAAELASSDDPSKTLSTVRDWSFVSQHEYWGYRFIRRKGLNGKDLAGLDQFLPGVEAIEFWIDVKQKAGVMRLLGSAGTKRAVPQLNKRIADEASGSMSFQPQSPGVWDAPISLSGGQLAMGKIWEIMDFFGYPSLYESHGAPSKDFQCAKSYRSSSGTLHILLCTSLFRGSKTERRSAHPFLRQGAGRHRLRTQGDQAVQSMRVHFEHPADRAAPWPVHRAGQFMRLETRSVRRMRHLRHLQSNLHQQSERRGSDGRSHHRLQTHQTARKLSN